MYLFVFLWTPSLRTDTSEDTPLGIVFASFMVSITIGSSLFGLAGTSKFRTNRILIRVFILALCSLTIPIVFSVCPSQSSLWCSFLFCRITQCDYLRFVFLKSHVEHIIHQWANLDKKQSQKPKGQR